MERVAPWQPRITHSSPCRHSAVSLVGRDCIVGGRSLSPQASEERVLRILVNLWSKAISSISGQEMNFLGEVLANQQCTGSVTRGCTARREVQGMQSEEATRVGTTSPGALGRSKGKIARGCKMGNHRK